MRPIRMLSDAKIGTTIVEADAYAGDRVKARISEPSVGVGGGVANSVALALVCHRSCVLQPTALLL